MDDQERNHEALIDRFDEQARIIRHRNDRIAEVEARANELALELAHAVTRAVKAEKGLDEALDDAESLRRQLHDAQQDADMSRAELESEQPRPLTADDVTDEMIERARNAPSFDGRLSPPPRLVREMLTAALTEPPKRPEGAEDWEDWLIEAMPHESMPDEDIALLADRIAQRLNEERS